MEYQRHSRSEILLVESPRFRMSWLAFSRPNFPIFRLLLKIFQFRSLEKVSNWGSPEISAKSPRV